MPLYEYACRQCDARFERLLSIQVAGDDVACPSCGAGKTRRLISLFSAVSRADGGVATSIAGAGGGCACSTGGCGCGCAH